MKRKEIKFKRNRNTYEGRQDGVLYRIYEDRTLVGTDTPACTVSTYDTKGEGRTIHLGERRRFTMDGAKEFCQKIAAGEVDLEALRAEIEAEDATKEQAAIRAAIEEAKEFRGHLEAAGISYNTLLDLMGKQEGLGSLAHNFLLGYESGEGWPSGT